MNVPGLAVGILGLAAGGWNVIIRRRRGRVGTVAYTASEAKPAFMNSRFSRAMLTMEISLGQTASQTR